MSGGRYFGAGRHAGAPEKGTTPLARLSLHAPHPSTLCARLLLPRRVPRDGGLRPARRAAPHRRRLRRGDAGVRRGRAAERAVARAPRDAARCRSTPTCRWPPAWAWPRTCSAGRRTRTTSSTPRRRIIVTLPGASSARYALAGLRRVPAAERRRRRAVDPRRRGAWPSPCPRPRSTPRSTRRWCSARTVWRRCYPSAAA